MFRDIIALIRDVVGLIGKLATPAKKKKQTKLSVPDSVWQPPAPPPPPRRADPFKE